MDALLSRFGIPRQRTDEPQPGRSRGNLGAALLLARGNARVR